jgi:NTP pyrophosphatase (non-canonical NTP hydrolase)
MNDRVKSLLHCEVEIERCWRAAFEESAYGVIGFEDWRKEREMIMEEFVKDALRTEPDLKAYWHAAGRVAQGIAQDSPGTNYLKLRLLHVGMGLATESGEFMDALKRHIFYGKELDKTNLIEELGDVTWYLRIACDVLGVSLAEVIQKNVDKLRKRFPDKFTEDKAVNRDLEGERATLARQKDGGK